jgi:hypothetical protein
MKYLWSLIVVLFAGCAHVHSFNQDTIVAGEGRFIETLGEKTVWFNWNFDSDFIDETHQRFLAECPEGQITGVSSRLSSENSFLHWKSRVRFTGYCGERTTPAAPEPASEPDSEPDL